MAIGQQLGGIALSCLLAIASTGCGFPEQIESREIPEIPAIPAQSIETLAAADVVFLGETHDSQEDHEAQLEIIQELHANNPNLAIGMEMFQRPYQNVLDRYISGEISEEEFLAESKYEKLWGFPWELYAPILRFARENNIPVLALNAPGDAVSRVAREGLVSLTAADFTYIPPIEELDLSNDNYRNFVQGAFGAHGAHGDFNFDNFFAAQVIWDETMAQTIADYRTFNPGSQVVVLAGQGHVIFGYGIPDRVQRRLGDDLNIQNVLLNPTAEFTLYGEAIADMFWWSNPPEELLNEDQEQINRKSN